MAGTRKRKTRSPRVPATQRISTNRLGIGKTPGTSVRLTGMNSPGPTKLQAQLPTAGARLLTGNTRRKRGQ